MDFEGVPTTVHNLLYSKCDNCLMETVTPSQTRDNKRIIIEAHKSALGLLTAAEILQLRKQLGITQIEAAKLFGGGVNAFSKYENSAITQTKAMDNVLRLALEVPGAAEHLAAREMVKLRRITETPISAAIMTEVGFIPYASIHLRRKTDWVLTGTGNTYESRARSESGQPRITFGGTMIKGVEPLKARAAGEIMSFNLSTAIN